jgi:hypothetical protein
LNCFASMEQFNCLLKYQWLGDPVFQTIQIIFKHSVVVGESWINCAQLNMHNYNNEHAHWSKPMSRWKLWSMFNWIFWPNVFNVFTITHID